MAVSDGEDPVEAMESATGLSLAQLRSELRQYLMSRRLMGRVIKSDFRQPTSSSRACPDPPMICCSSIRD